MSYIKPCPGCGKPIGFLTAKPAYRSCDCGKVIRQDEYGQLTQTKESAVDLFAEIIQPGTTGVFNERGFVVKGRLRLRFDQTVLNYWDVSFGKDNDCWLMEAYGMYGILKRNDDTKIPFDGALVNLTVGAVAANGEKEWILESKDKIFEISFEGEVKSNGYRKHANIYGMASAKGDKLLVMEWQNNQYEVYEVLFTSFAELQLQQLRQPVYSPEKFQCTECKALITVQHFPYAGSVACTNCSQVYVYKYPHGFAKEKKLKRAMHPAIPLGAEGELKGSCYKVLGYAEKTGKGNTDLRWQEYGLYNSQEGFAFLREDDGHWSYLRKHLETPVLLDRAQENCTFKKETFLLFRRYRASVTAAAGEFPGNFFDDSQATVREYISPPEMWIRDENFNEGISWYHAQHLSQAEIQNSFGLDTRSSQAGVGALQPTGYLNRYKVIIATAVCVTLLILLHNLIGGNKEEKLLLEKKYALADSLGQTFNMGPFELTKFSSNMELDFYAQVQNSWFKLNATLVNMETGKEISLEKGVEYYEGKEGAERWSEGSRRDQIYFTAIPPGTYMLNIKTTRPATAALNDFELKVMYDIPNGVNIWWAVTLFLLYPVFRLLKDFFLETRRWNNNPLSQH
ncbi:MAG: DUF4178 domain-containing protein [Pseudobacter sp.]|uniref:DUF4178 domain-containing protein n=1 Tax=Pseudobacter sp. TaxID=2045420 RepID=UPI003F820F71